MASTWRVCLRQTSLLYQPLVRAALLCPSHKATWLPIASAVPFRALSSSHSSDYSHQVRWTYTYILGRSVFQLEPIPVLNNTFKNLSFSIYATDIKFSMKKRRNSAVSHDADQMDTLGTKALKIIARMSGFYSRKNVS